MTNTSVGILAFALLALSQLVFGANIEDVRKDAVKKLEANVNAVKQANNKVNLLIQDYQANINVIADAKQTQGLGIAEKTHEELYKLSVSFGMRASLMNVKPEVVSCVEKTHTTAQDVYGKYAEEQFEDPAFNLEYATGNAFRDKLYKWYYLYHNKTANYTSLYNQINKDVAAAKTETEIKTKVTLFAKETNTFIDFIFSIIYNAINDQKELMKKLTELLDKLRDFSRKMADQTGLQMEKCFPKAFTLLRAMTDGLDS